MITKDLIGKTTKVKGCLTFFPQTPAYTYGLGIVSTGNWLVQDPLFSRRVRCHRLPAVTTSGDRPDGHLRACRLHQPVSPKNSADYLWRMIAAKLAPADAPLIPPNAQ
jgi:hypothetical protein